MPRNLILRYTTPGGIIVDPMCGSGTTLVEARLLGRHAAGVDINPAAIEMTSKRLTEVPAVPGVSQDVRLGDARALTGFLDGSVDLVALHPPYWNIIAYSQAIEGDLSRMSHDAFLAGIAKVASESYRILKSNGHCALLMGDARRRKHVVPLSFEAMHVFQAAGLVLREHVIKLQHNTSSERSWPGQRDFLLLAHENLFVFRKPGRHEHCAGALLPSQAEDR